MFDYTCLGGKYWRASLVLNTVQVLSAESGRDVARVWEPALVLGWCIEIVSTLAQTGEAQCADCADGLVCLRPHRAMLM